MNNSMTTLEEIVELFGSAVAIFDLHEQRIATSSCWRKLFDDDAYDSTETSNTFQELLDLLSRHAADSESLQSLDLLRQCPHLAGNTLGDNGRSETLPKSVLADSELILRVIARNSRIVPLVIKRRNDRLTFSETLSIHQNSNPSTFPSLVGQRVDVFRQFLENSECPGYIRYKNQILHANRALAEIHGYNDVDDFLSTRILSDHYREQDREAIADIAEADGIILDTIPQIGKQGQEIYAIAVGSAFFDDGIQYRIVLCKDVNTHVRDENALKESEQRFRDIASCSGDWFWDTDTDHKLTRISSNESQIPTFRLETLVGNTIWHWIDKQKAAGFVSDYEESVAVVRDTMEQHKPVHDLELNARNLKTLTSVTVLLNAKPLFSSDNLFLGYRGITKDITYQKKLEHRLLEAKQRAEYQSRTKSAFIASMSHELRTPLTSILGYVELIRREARQGRSHLDDDQLNHIETIWKSGDQLRSLVNNVLSIERLESGFDRTDIVATDLSEVLLEMKQTFALASTINNTSLHCVSDGSIPATFYTDPVKLRQILHNIIGNATKFTTDGSIGIRTTYCNEKFILTIEDTGVGMSADQLDSLTAPSSTVNISETLARGGGLGLVLCKHYVSQLGGELSIKSHLNSGTTVQISLPDRLADMNGVTPSYTKVASSAYRRFPGNTTHLRSKILIVDDNEDHRRLLHGMINHLNVDILQALDGIEALALWHKFSPDLIFMDLRMPGLDGSSTTMQIRKKQVESNYGPCRIVAISADETNHSEDNLIEKGFDAFLPKPFKANEIHQVMFDLGLSDTILDAQKTNPARFSPR